MTSEGRRQNDLLCIIFLSTVENKSVMILEVLTLLIFHEVRSLFLTELVVLLFL